MKYLKINNLEKGWQDRDELLLHAAFQILSDFLDEEIADGAIDWQSDEKHSNAYSEILSLTHWYKETRPHRADPLDNKELKCPPHEFEKIDGTSLSKMKEYDKQEYKEYTLAVQKHHELTQMWFEEDQANLHRLIDIREYLWT